MIRKVSGTTKYIHEITEKFSMIYMEVHDPREKITRNTLWHLEDEQRVVVALCGLVLKGVCKSVSSALAMLGKPCPDCLVIVREYINGEAGELNKESVRINRVKSLQVNDLRFRTNVKRIVDETEFIARFDLDKFKDAFPDWEKDVNKDGFIKKVLDAQL